MAKQKNRLTHNSSEHEQCEVIKDGFLNMTRADKDGDENCQLQGTFECNNRIQNLIIEKTRTFIVNQYRELLLEAIVLVNQTGGLLTNLEEVSGLAPTDER